MSRVASAISAAIDEHAGARAEQQRHARQRRQHEAGQHRVRQRLGCVRVAQVQQPDAERAARRAEHDDLQQRALQQAGVEDLHQCAWCWIGDRAVAAVQQHDLRAVGGLEHGVRQRVGRRAVRDLLAAQAQDAIPAARLLDVVGGDQQHAALGAQVVEDPHDRLLAGLVDSRERLVEQQHAGVLDERAGDQHALALAARQRAEALARVLGEADALQRSARQRAVGGGHAPVPRRARIGAHQRDVERADGEVQARALGLRDVRCRAGDRDLAGDARKLAEQGAEQRRLAAAVGPEHGDGLAGERGERHVAQGGRARRVGGVQAGDLDARGVGAHARDAAVLRGRGASGAAEAIAASANTPPPTSAIAGPGRQVEVIGEQQAGDALARGERDGGREQRAERAGQQARGRRRDDEQRADEQRADGGQHGDDARGQQREQQPVAARAGHAERPRAAGVEARREPRAPERRGRDRRGERDGGGEPQVAVAEPEQRAEQQPVDAAARAVDVAGEHAAERQRAGQQQPGGGVRARRAAARDARQQAGEAERGAERGERRRDRPRPGDDETGERRAAGGMDEERQAPQHDPRSEQPAGDRQQQRREQRALHERSRQGIGEPAHRPGRLSKMVLT